MRLVLLLSTLLAPGCLNVRVTVCDDGAICPPDKVCHPWGGGCVYPDQLTSCAGLSDDAPCNVAGSPVGQCQDGFCIAPGCGNGRVDIGEACEPAVSAATCNDFGFYQGGEVQCTADCTYDISHCRERCGDGLINGPEICDGAPPQVSCLQFGFDAGMTSCAELCGWNFDTCSHIGFVREDGIAPGPLWVSPTGTAFIATHDGFSRRSLGGGWQRVTGLPADLQIVGISGTGDQNVLILAANDAQVFRYDGTVFTSIGAKAGAVATALWAALDGQIFVIGEGGFVHHFDGTAWTAPNTGATEDLYAIAGSSPTNVWAVGKGLRTLRYDGTWTSEILSAATGYTLTDVAVTRSGKAFAVGKQDADGVDNGALLARGASSWTLISKSQAQAAGYVSVFADEDEVFIGTDEGRILRYADGTWSDINGLGTPRIFDIQGLDATTLWAASDSSVLRYDGRGWNFWSLPSQESLRMRYLAPDHMLGVVGSLSSGAIVAYDGQQWTELKNDADLWSKAGIWVRGTSEAYLATGVGAFQYDGDALTPIADDVAYSAAHGTANRIYLGRRDEGAVDVFDGDSWSSEAVFASGPIYDLFAVSDEEVYAVGFVNSSIAHRIGPNNWQLEVAPTERYLKSVWVSPEGIAFAVGDDGAVVEKQQGGSWQRLTTPAVGELHTIDGTGIGDIWIGGDGGGLYHFDGLEWSIVNPANQTSAIVDVHTFGERVLVSSQLTASDAGMLLSLVESTPDP